MAFTVADFQDLLRLLHEHPEWRMQLWAVLAGEELLRLPAEIRAFREETDRRFGELAEAVRQLAEAQTRTERRLEEFIRVVERQFGLLERELGRLSQRVGPAVESGLAQALLERVLPARNLSPVEPWPRPVEIDGLEVDLVIQVRDAAGRSFWVLAEARGRVRPRDVREAAAKLKNPKNLARLRAVGLDGPFIPYLGGLQVYRGVEDAARRAGIGLFDPAGELAPPEASGAD